MFTARSVEPTTYPNMAEAHSLGRIDRIADEVAAQTFGVGFNDLSSFLATKRDDGEGKETIQALDVLLRRLFEHRNRLLRLELLPAEILLDIFTLAIDFDEFSDIKANTDLGADMPKHYARLTRLQMVQKKWHDIIASFGPFWSLLSARMPQDVLERVSRQSQESTLVVRVGWYRDGAHERLSAFLHTILPLAKRIGTLSLDLQERRNPLIPALWESCTNLQNLQLIRVDKASLRSPAGTEIVEMPSPRWIHIKSGQTRLPIPFNRAEELVIQSPRSVLTARYLRYVVDQMPNLRRLCFDEIHQLDYTASGASELPLIAPNLKSLEIHGSDGRVTSWLLDCFRLSPSTSLNIHTSDQTTINSCEVGIRSYIKAVLQTIKDFSFALEVTPQSYRLQTREVSVEIKFTGKGQVVWPDFFQGFIPRPGQSPIRVYVFLSSTNDDDPVYPNESCLAGLHNDYFVMM
ncbi:hypothetical protein FRB90_005139 [Tulasnella sp. 427]|nr:hypothetical protein FRB90_005139 [Tulasnella sp. 427]